MSEVNKLPYEKKTKNNGNLLKRATTIEKWALRREGLLQYNWVEYI